MNIQYVVDLTAEERAELLALTSKGTCSTRKQKSGHILILADQGESDQRITELLSVGTSTIYRVKKAFVKEGIEQSLNECPRTGRPRKLDGKEEALVVATACSKPPEGRSLDTEITRSTYCRFHRPREFITADHHATIIRK